MMNIKAIRQFSILFFGNSIDQLWNLFMSE